MQLSKLGEISALTPIEKPIFLPEQVAGHEMMWAEDNLKNYPYLLVNLRDANGNEMASGAIGHTKPPQIPQAMAALRRSPSRTCRTFSAAKKLAKRWFRTLAARRSNWIQSRPDMQSFIYMSNMAKAVKRSGEIWLNGARHSG